MDGVKIQIAWQGSSDCQNCTIRSSALFAELNEDDFSKIQLPINEANFIAGAHVYHQGDTGECVFTLRTGYVKLLHLNEDGTERIVRLIKPGDLFGMESLLDANYENSAIALTAVSFCKIPSSVLKNLGEVSPRLHRQMMKKLSEALSESQLMFSELNTGKVEIRLARFLLRFSKIHDEQVCISPLFKREDMGLMMGVKFETISRALSHLKEINLISEIGRSSVQINDIQRLQKYCQDGI